MAEPRTMLSEAFNWLPVRSNPVVSARQAWSCACVWRCNLQECRCRPATNGIGGSAGVLSDRIADPELEATVCALAASIQGPVWLEAVKDLRGPQGFKVKNVFQQLKAAARKLAAFEPTLDDLDQAEELYSARKILFHSVWGVVSGTQRAAVGIQEWSNDSYDNFRHIPLEEIEAFASKCAVASQSLMKTAIPLFHGAASIVVDDGDGLTKGH